MGIARRRFVKVAAWSIALTLPAAKCIARVTPCVEAIRSRVYPIPARQLRPGDVEKPGRWGG